MPKKLIHRCFHPLVVRNANAKEILEGKCLYGSAVRVECDHHRRISHHVAERMIEVLPEAEDGLLAEGMNSVNVE